MKATTLAFILMAVASAPARGAEAPAAVRDQIIAATQGLFDALTEGKVAPRSMTAWNRSRPGCPSARATARRNAAGGNSSAGSDTTAR